MVSAEDRAAFYAIMDEYFASRPHFKPGSSSNTAQPTAGAAATKKPAPPPPARRANPAAAAPSAHAGGPAQDYYSGAQSYQPPAQRYNPPAQTEPPAAPSAENRTYAVALYACVCANKIQWNAARRPFRCCWRADRAARVHLGRLVARPEPGRCAAGYCASQLCQRAIESTRGNPRVSRVAVSCFATRLPPHTCK